MFAKPFRPLLGVVLTVFLAATAAAQTPSPAQQTPAAIARLQQMMQASGMSPEQIHDRLKAQGYPESLLDQYLPGAARTDSTSVPSDDVFAAIKALGLGDSTAVDSLAGMSRNRRRFVAKTDSAFMDSVMIAIRNDTTRAALRALMRSRDLQNQQNDSGFVVFGQGLFRGDSTASLAPNMAGGADANYRFGPGDRLVLFLTGDVEQSYPLTVTREGFVVIPKVGVVNVAGMTRSQLEDALYLKLGAVYSGVRRGSDAKTRFFIDLSQSGTNQVFVGGDVAHPGSYRVSRAGTVMSALYLAGGPTQTGSMRNVQVTRNGQIVASLDVYDYALRGDANHDARLENGDIVFVLPRGPQVRVAGAVLRPATYEIKAGQTLADVVQMAGGFNELADRRRVQIDRIVPPADRVASGDDRQVVDVPGALLSTAPVRGGDVIRVLQIAKRVGRRVAVLGNVWSPGPVAYTPGMHLFDAFRNAGGLKPDSYLGQVLISRLQPDSTRNMLRTAVFDTTGRPVDNMFLTDGDEVTVFSTTDFRPKRYITVNGPVRKPGQIPFREGMTLRDAVLLAGGLLEGASLTNAEIARLPETRAAGVTAISQIVPLDSSYVFERGANGRYVGPTGLPAPSSVAPEVPLEPYDAILIKRQPEWQLQQTVAVHGEVKYPGDYSIVNKSERLSDIIRRAGGLTSVAYPGGIVFVRRQRAIAGRTAADSLANRGVVEGASVRVGLDLPAVLKDSNFVDNLQLADGDSIFIPRFAPVVLIRGAVNSQVGVAYLEGADLAYYVRSGGGPTVKGDPGRAYVTQPNGKVETRQGHVFYTSEPHPQPGSTVMVPEKDPLDHRDWVQIASTLTALLGSLVAVVALLKR
jgi:polysaccharide export outer membrane protein